MSDVDLARWRAWGGVADIMGLRVVFTPDVGGGWIATARRCEGRGATGTDALAMLCRVAAARRK